MAEIHRLKIRPEYFAVHTDGSKNFEIRHNDRGFKVGDLVVLCEYNGATITGRRIYREIAYITDFGQAEGWVVFSTRITPASSALEEREVTS